MRHSPSVARILMRIYLWLVHLGIISLTALSAHAAMIDVVLSGDGPVYQEVVAGMRKGLSTKHDIRVLTAEELPAQRAPDSALIVTVGVHAAIAAAASSDSSPLLAILVPRQTYESLEWKTARSRSALYLDQPLKRQFDLIHLLVPDRKHVGVLLGGATAVQLKELQSAAEAAGLELQAESLHGKENLVNVLRGVLQNNEVLFTLPDAEIINPASIRHILLTSYQFREPVFSYSAGYVKAGALAAVFSTPEQIGRQAGGIIESQLRTGNLPPPQYPSEFSVQINTHVAHSLGIDVPNENATALLRRDEGAAQ
jgi:ABC-type uncharacterized transport system substrate-binding protein